MATCGQLSGADHWPRVAASVAAAWKLTTTVCVWVMLTAQLPCLLPTPVALRSHWPPDHALIGRPVEVEALSVTVEALGNWALHPDADEPSARVHLIPAGVELTVPLPPPAR